MNGQKAKIILATDIQSDNSLKNYYVADGISWKPGDELVSLDGEFTAEKLEAIAWWMKNR